jgi:hypothetical protein
MDKGSSIQSSQSRGTGVSHSVINGFAPLNGEESSLSTAKAGKDTRNIEKSNSDSQAGPKTNNL